MWLTGFFPMYSSMRFFDPGDIVLGSVSKLKNDQSQISLLTDGFMSKSLIMNTDTQSFLYS